MTVGSDYEGLLYRALNPRWAAQPMSGEGAALYGGRFNALGTPALYTSSSPLTALKEAQQSGTFQPVTLVAYEVAITQIFDGRDPAALAEFSMTVEDLADPGWRDAMRRRRLAPTQAFAARLVATGTQALLVPSFATGAGPEDLNLVLFKWNTENGATLRVIDDEQRLQMAR